MQLKALLVVLTGAVSVQPAVAQEGQANAQIIAQALDRCMATYAVRLTRTAASDEEIYAEANRSCAPLNAKFVDAIHAEVPPQQAADLLKTLDETAKPNFFRMLAQIRSDRAKRESLPNGQ